MTVLGVYKSFLGPPNRRQCFSAICNVFEGSVSICERTRTVLLPCEVLPFCPVYHGLRQHQCHGVFEQLLLLEAKNCRTKIPIRPIRPPSSFATTPPYIGSKKQHRSLIFTHHLIINVPVYTVEQIISSYMQTSCYN